MSNLLNISSLDLEEIKQNKEKFLDEIIKCSDECSLVTTFEESIMWLTFHEDVCGIQYQRKSVPYKSRKGVYKIDIPTDNDLVIGFVLPSSKASEIFPVDKISQMWLSSYDFEDGKNFTREEIQVPTPDKLGRCFFRKPFNNLQHKKKYRLEYVYDKNSKTIGHVLSFTFICYLFRQNIRTVLAEIAD